MHEYSLVAALLEQVGDHLAAHPGAVVRRVTVRVGDASGVVAELLATAFEVARERTPCANATLTLERVPARWQCTGCAAPIPEGDRLTCAACGAPAALMAGDELHLMRIELETKDA